MSRFRFVDHPGWTSKLWLGPRRVVVAFGFLALGACASSEPGAPPPPCPAAVLLDGAERTSAYRAGAEPGPAELRYIAVLSDLASTCRYTDEGVEIDLAFNLAAERGPALPSASEEVSYFVAMLAPDGRIVSRAAYATELDFEEGYAGALWSEQLTLLIRSVTPAQGADHMLYVGFQLDDAQLSRRQQPPLR
jgi:hypothetical protein